MWVIWYGQHCRFTAGLIICLWSHHWLPKGRSWRSERMGRAKRNLNWITWPYSSMIRINWRPRWEDISKSIGYYSLCMHSRCPVKEHCFLFCYMLLFCIVLLIWCKSKLVESFVWHEYIDYLTFILLIIVLDYIQPMNSILCNFYSIKFTCEMYNDSIRTSSIFHLDQLDPSDWYMQWNCLWIFFHCSYFSISTS